MAVKFLGVPELQQQITIAGYPIGGDSLSITQGIVSRVTMSCYTPGAAPLINVQVRICHNSPRFVTQSGKHHRCDVCFCSKQKPGPQWYRSQRRLSYG
jgi:hypothetical protein